MKNLLVLSLLFVLLISQSCNTPAPTPAEPEDRMQWWTDAKFGLFIHWGVYAVPAGFYKDQPVAGIGEWIMNRGKIPVAEYKPYAKEFNPVNYDPEAWVKMAKDAGMKYLVITSKHHDGFALFDSKVTDWDVVDATPYGKDLLKPLAEACRKHGIKLGFYYSQAQDWNHPGGAASGGHWDPAQDGDMDAYLDNIAVPQVKEILENYGGLDILWWDTPTDMNPERAAKFLPIVAQYPNLITNNRLGGGIEGDTETPEQFIPATGFPGRNWEVCMTMNDTWGFKSDDHNWKSTKDLILKLSDIVSKGGNFLLNVGPTALGEIPQPSIERLQQVGQWMRINGEAIYGTKASPFPYLPWGKATRRDQKLYLHVINWPSDGKLRVPLNNKATTAELLASPGKKLEVSSGEGFVEISVPPAAPDQWLSIIAMEFEGEPSVLPIPTSGKTGLASSVDSTTQIANLFDGDPRNAWKPVKGENKAWIEVDLGETVTINNLSVAEPWKPWNNKSQEFQLQYKSDDQWVDVISGKTNGTGLSLDFPAVTGQYFRLNITGPEGEVPVLNEWILNRAL
jgi:alpha-L-fucosidase